MNGVQNWGEAITISLLGMWGSFVDFIPSFIGALIVFMTGWIVASAFGKIIEKVIKTVKIDDAFKSIGWGSWLADMGLNASVGAFLGGIVRWFLVLVFLMAATDILQLNQVTAFLNNILIYIPNVVVAVIILAIVFLVGNLVYSVVKGSTRAAGVMSATLLATISKWSIIIFGVLAALLQLGIAESLVNTIFIGIVAMLSLAGGLAFGLGGKDEAAMLLRKLREELTEKN